MDGRVDHSGFEIEEEPDASDDDESVGEGKKDQEDDGLEYKSRSEPLEEVMRKGDHCGPHKRPF